MSEVRNPATGEVLREVAGVSVAETDAAIERAERAYGSAFTDVRNVFIAT